MLACSGTYVKELGKRQTRFWSQIDAGGLNSLLYLPCSKQLRRAVLITTPWLIVHDYTRTYVIYIYIRYLYIYILYTPSICVTGPLFANPHSKIQMCNPCKFHLLPPWKFLSNCCFWTSAGQQDAGAMLKNSQLTIEHKQYQFQEK